MTNDPVLKMTDDELCAVALILGLDADFPLLTVSNVDEAFVRGRNSLVVRDLILSNADNFEPAPVISDAVRDMAMAGKVVTLFGSDQSGNPLEGSTVFVWFFAGAQAVLDLRTPLGIHLIARYSSGSAISTLIDQLASISDPAEESTSVVGYDRDSGRSMLVDHDGMRAGRLEAGSFVFDLETFPFSDEAASEQLMLGR